MSIADNSISVTELRKHISEVLETAQKGGRYAVHQGSRKVAVIVGMEEWRMMNETIEILTDRTMVEQINQSETAIDHDETRPAEEVFRDIESDLDPVDPSN